MTFKINNYVVMNVDPEGATSMDMIPFTYYFAVDAPWYTKPVEEGDLRVDIFQSAKEHYLIFIVGKRDSMKLTGLFAIDKPTDGTQEGHYESVLGAVRSLLNMVCSNSIPNTYDTTIRNINSNEFLADNSHDMNKQPVIFTFTKYALPSNLELEDVNNCGLSCDEVLNGFYYTMVGKGILNSENKDLIVKSINMLCEKYPNNAEYKKAFEKATVLNVVKQGERGVKECNKQGWSSVKLNDKDNNVKSNLQEDIMNTKVKSILNEMKNLTVEQIEDLQNVILNPTRSLNEKYKVDLSPMMADRIKDIVNQKNQQQMLLLAVGIMESIVNEGFGESEAESYIHLLIDNIEFLK